jgi:hypothetical protein
VISSNSYSQTKRGNAWVSGYGDVKVEFTASGIITKSASSLSTYFIEGNSSISDTDGSLIIYSDGFNIFNSANQVIEEGDTLVPILYFNQQVGFSGYAQSSIFLPMMNNKYYFITPAMSDARSTDCVSGGSCYFDLLLYNVIDMNANNGAGKVIQRMKPLMQNAELRKTQMMACRHGNGKDWWLLKQEGDNADVHTFLFTQDSVIDKGVQFFNEPNWWIFDLRGQSVFSVDGSKYATTSQGWDSSSSLKIFLADFDRCEGKLSNSSILSVPLVSQNDPSDTSLPDWNIRGVVFSPNGRFLYAMLRTNVFQYDFLDSTWYHVVGLDTSWQYSSTYGSSYLGPDNKIYVGNGGTGKQMSVIDNPDVKGIGCNFCRKCLRVDSLGANAYLGTPPCMPNYSLGAKPCWPLDTPVVNANDGMVVYPNPATGKFQIKNSKYQSSKELFNSVGQIIVTTTKNEIDVSSLSKGVYFLKCEGETKKVIIE